MKDLMLQRTRPALVDDVAAFPRYRCHGLTTILGFHICLFAIVCF